MQFLCVLIPIKLSDRSYLEDFRQAVRPITTAVMMFFARHAHNPLRIYDFARKY